MYIPVFGFHVSLLQNSGNYFLAAFKLWKPIIISPIFCSLLSPLSFNWYPYWRITCLNIMKHFQVLEKKNSCYLQKTNQKMVFNIRQHTPFDMMQLSVVADITAKNNAHFVCLPPHPWIKWGCCCRRRRRLPASQLDGRRFSLANHRSISRSPSSRSRRSSASCTRDAKSVHMFSLASP